MIGLWRRILLGAVALLALPVTGTAGKQLELFVGSASKPATEEAARLFEQRTGVRVLLHFGGSGRMLTEMKLARRGDCYFPGSSDFMERAKQEQLVVPETEQRILYVVPAINVPAGNPQQVRCLEDLTRPGLRIGIARPDTVCVGLYAVEVLEHSALSPRVRPNIVTHVASCAKTAQLVALGNVDAVLGWRVFSFWNPAAIETVLLQPAHVPRIGYIPIAVSVFCVQPQLAREFIAYLASPGGQAVYRQWHYLTTEHEARQYALPTTPVGGTWALPASWK